MTEIAIIEFVFIVWLLYTRNRRWYDDYYYRHKANHASGMRCDPRCGYCYP